MNMFHIFPILDDEQRVAANQMGFFHTIPRKLAHKIHQWNMPIGSMYGISTARLLRLPRRRNRLGNRPRWMRALKGAVEPCNPKPIPKSKALNVVSSVLFRVQYKNETPNQSLKFKTLNVVSCVLWRVQYKHENPNQSLKFKTLNVACSMCSQVQWDHETPNQSLNLQP